MRETPSRRRLTAYALLVLAGLIGSAAAVARGDVGFPHDVVLCEYRWAGGKVALVRLDRCPERESELVRERVYSYSPWRPLATPRAREAYKRIAQRVTWALPACATALDSGYMWDDECLARLRP